MALRPVDIILRALGVEQTQQKVSGAAGQMSASVSKATGAMSKEFAEAQKRVERLQAIIAKRPNSLGLKVAEQQARELRDRLLDAETQARKTSQALQQIKSPNLTTRLTGFNTVAARTQDQMQKYAPLQQGLGDARNAGVGVAAVGVGGLMLSNKLAEKAREVEEAENLVSVAFGESTEEINKWSQNLQDKLGITATTARRNAGTFMLMFSSMGVGEQASVKMSKGLVQLSYDIASLRNISFEEAFEKLSAGMTGEAEPLKRIGILVNDTTIKQYAYAHGIAVAGEELTEQQKVLARYGQIMQATAKDQGDLERTMGSATNVQRIAGETAERAMIAYGRGSASAQKWVDELKTRDLAFAGANETVAVSMGWAGTFGSYLMVGVGGLVAFGAQVGQVYVGLQALKVARAENAAVAAAEAAATNANTTADTANAAAKGASTASIGVNTIAVEGNAAAMVVQTASMEGATAATASYTAASLAAKIGVAAIGIAAAYTVAQVAFAVGQHLGWIDKERNMVDDLKIGWKSLGDQIGLTSHAAEVARNQMDADKEIQKEKLKNAEDADAGKITREEEQKRNRETELKWREKQAQEAKRLGNNEEYLKQHEAAAQLREQGKLSVSASPTVDTTTPSDSTPVTATPTLSIDDSATESASTGPSLQPQIRALQDKIRATKDKTEKAQLKDQLIQLQRAEQDRKAAESAAKKAEAHSKKIAGWQADVEQLREKTAGDLESAQLDANQKIAQSQARIALDSQVKRINDLKEAGVLDDEAAENQVNRLKHAYEVRNAAMQKDAMIRAAQVEAQAELAQAQADASTQEAAQAQATLAKAKIKSDAILKKAQIEAGVIGSDIAPLEDSKSKFQVLADYLKGGGSLMNLNKKGQGMSPDVMSAFMAGLGLPQFSRATALSGNSGAMFGMRSGNYGGEGAFSVARGGGYGFQTVFDQAYRGRNGEYRAPGASTRKPPRAKGRFEGYAPDGSLIIGFEKLTVPNPFNEALEAIS